MRGFMTEISLMKRLLSGITEDSS